MAASPSLVSNPLLQDFEFPPFDVFNASHVRPGIRALLKKLELERMVEPSWPKLVVVLFKKITDKLSVVWGIVKHVKAIKDSPELRAVVDEVQVFNDGTVRPPPFHLFDSRSLKKMAATGNYIDPDLVLDDGDDESYYLPREETKET